MPIGLHALAPAGFGIGIAEFVIVGLMPDIAAEYAVPEGTAGILVSGYAIAVALGALVVTAAVSRLDRNRVLLALLAAFILGNVFSATAPVFGIMLLGRVIAALCHGAFYGVATALAASLVPAQKNASAVSFMLAGLTVAMVLGVPAGTFLGQVAGWRSTFWAIGLIAAISTIGITLLVSRPAEAPAESSVPLRDELRIVARPAVLASGAISMLVSGGAVTAFTYIAFTSTEVSGIAAEPIPWLLLFGVGTFLGNALDGKLADRAVERTLAVFIPVAALVMALFAMTAQMTVLAVVFTGLMGVAAFTNVPGLQLRTMTLAGEAPTLASGANTAALNVGNALGVWIGGIVLTTSLGFTGPTLVGASFAAIAFVLFLATRRSTRPVETAPVAGAAPETVPAGR